ncbi:hypothetical protein Aduo_015602 [Ancylostoma duodenale]
MTEFAGVFFPRSNSSDVISLDDVIGSASVGQLTKVRWHSRVYTAKVLCVEDKEQCKGKIALVSVDGEIQNPVFSRWRSTHPLSVRMAGDMHRKRASGKSDQFREGDPDTDWAT